MYISADLFQSSSVLAYSSNAPMPSYPDKTSHYLPILANIQASKQPSIHVCLDPLLHHLKGAALGPHRPPQAARGSGPESRKSA